jgi:hypothetical protein
MLENFALEMPDYALDMHTMKGKAMGHDLDHFRKEGAKLVPSRPLMIRTRINPTGCGRSSSAASKPKHPSASSRLTRSRKPASSNPAARG